MEIKIRYVFKHRITGAISKSIILIQDLETRLTEIDLRNYEIISRDLFTGKQDKSGKDIYENDIIKLREEIFLIGYNICKFILRFRNGVYSRDLYDWIIINEPIEIIGNTHENPELLEAANAL